MDTFNSEPNQISRDLILKSAGELIDIKQKLIFIKNVLMTDKDTEFKGIRIDMQMEIAYAIKYIERAISAIMLSENEEIFKE